jgi:hypothetical protein
MDVLLKAFQKNFTAGSGPWRVGMSARYKRIRISSLSVGKQ